MGATASQGGEADHEKVQTRERDHIDGQLAKVGVQLTGESKAGSHAGHDGGHQIIEVPVRWIREL